VARGEQGGNPSEGGSVSTTMAFMGLVACVTVAVLMGAGCAPAETADNGGTEASDVPAEDTAPSTTAGDTSPPTEGPPPEVITDPARMVAEPDVIAAGEVTSVRFPLRDGRTPGFVIERSSVDGWVWEWAVHSDPDASDQRVWSAEEFQRLGVAWSAGPGFDDDRPHLIPVPQGSSPGRYRVCTVASQPTLCAEFVVAPAP
jgi:hypothetical protein